MVSAQQLALVDTAVRTKFIARQPGATGATGTTGATGDTGLVTAGW